MLMMITIQTLLIWKARPEEDRLLQCSWADLHLYHYSLRRKCSIAHRSLLLPKFPMSWKVVPVAPFRWIMSKLIKPCCPFIDLLLHFSFVCDLVVYNENE